MATLNQKVDLPPERKELAPSGIQLATVLFDGLIKKYLALPPPERKELVPSGTQLITDSGY